MIRMFLLMQLLLHLLWHLLLHLFLNLLLHLLLRINFPLKNREISDPKLLNQIIINLEFFRGVLIKRWYKIIIFQELFFNFFSSRNQNISFLNVFFYDMLIIAFLLYLSPKMSEAFLYFIINFEILVVVSPSYFLLFPPV